MNYNEKAKYIIVSVIATLIIMMSVPALAEVAQKNITVAYSNIKLYVDGKQITAKDSAGNIVEPFTYNGTTYLPVRAVGEALGKNVSWDETTQTVYIGDGGSTVTTTANSEWIPLSPNYSVGWGTFTRDPDLLNYGDGSFQNGIIHKPSNLGTGDYYLASISGLDFKKMKISIYSKNIDVTIQVHDKGNEIYKEINAPANKVVTAEFDIYNTPLVKLSSNNLIYNSIIFGDVYFSN